MYHAARKLFTAFPHDTFPTCGCSYDDSGRTAASGFSTLKDDADNNSFVFIFKSGGDDDDDDVFTIRRLINNNTSNDNTKPATPATLPLSKRSENGTRFEFDDMAAMPAASSKLFPSDAVTVTVCVV